MSQQQAGAERIQPAKGLGYQRLRHDHNPIVQLDLGQIHAYDRQKDPRGEKACWEDSTVRGLTGNQQPDRRRISDSRRRHLHAFAGLVMWVLCLGQINNKRGLDRFRLRGLEQGNGEGGLMATHNTLKLVRDATAMA